MLALLRRVVALCVLLAFAALCSGMVPEAYVMRLMGIPRVQVVPLVLSACGGSFAAAGVLAAVFAATLLFGRVYCSWLCPLGIMQDIVYRLRYPRGMKQGRYTPNHVWVRAFFAGLAFLAFVCGASLILAVLDPYTGAAQAFGTLRHLLLTPPAEAELGAGWLGIGLICVCLAVPLGMAAWRGRLYCNTVCPVGALLGLLARVAPFAPRLHADSCRRCGNCLRRCKAHAIDVRHGRVDRTRCVGCYDCLAACPHGALSLRPRRAARPSSRQDEAAADPTRRAMLGVGALTLASVLLPLPARGEEKAEVAGVEDEETPPILPPGAGENRERFLSVCTGCGLCIANCPTGVLRPAWTAHGWTGITKPYLSYGEDDVFCRYDCHTCSSLCPEGALMPLSPAEKQHTCVALAVHHAEHCTPWNTGYDCGRCAEACPTGAMSLHPVHVPLIKADQCSGCRRCARTCPQGAISMVEVAGRERKLAVIDRNKCIGCGNCAESCRRHALESRRTEVPAFRPELCTGCGACHAACPATPQRAITMQPLRRHTKTM